MIWSDEATKAATGKPPKFPLAEREYFLRSIRWINQVTVTDDASGEDWRKSSLPELAHAPPTPIDPPGRKVVVTGCFDWFHSGHVRFFEEVSELGDLYVIVGNDPNLRHLKGEGHPLFSQEQRRYIAGAIRFVKLALISSGMGWMDGEPEILKIKPQIYAVNEDGDKPEKAAFCKTHGIEYRVLKRSPKQGLPRRQSTILRGF
jgi:cytidyltransferase-like protein